MYKIHELYYTLAVLMAILQAELGYPAPECLHSRLKL